MVVVTVVVMVVNVVMTVVVNIGKLSKIYCKLMGKLSMLTYFNRQNIFLVYLFSFST